MEHYINVTDFGLVKQKGVSAVESLWRSRDSGYESKPLWGGYTIATLCNVRVARDTCFGQLGELGVHHRRLGVNHVEFRQPFCGNRLERDLFTFG